jgi:hypothetical protein
MSDHHHPHRERHSRKHGHARPASSLAEALMRALTLIEEQRVKDAATHRENPDDDDEDPTRRLGKTD